MTVQQLRQHELGAHAVGARDENRILHVFEGSSGEQAAKAADTADDLGTVGLLDHLLDGVDRAATFSRIDAGVLIRHVLRVLAHWASFRVERFGTKKMQTPRRGVPCRAP